MNNKYLYRDTISSPDLNYYFRRDYVLHDDLAVEEVNGGIIVPKGHKCREGVYDNCGQFVALSAERVSASDFLSKDIGLFINESAVVYIGQFSTGHYGNFLIDYLSRLWYRLGNKDEKFVYVAPKNILTWLPWCRKILAYLGIDEKQLIWVEQPTRFSCVVVPQKSFVVDKYIHLEYFSIFSRIYENVEKEDWKVYDMIYLTRTKLKRKKEIGEKMFERFFEMNGYKVMAPELLPFAQQAFYLRHCKVVASIEGTHAHNSVFMNLNGGYKQIVLRKQSEVIPRQIQINQAANIETVFIDVWKEPIKGFPISHDRGPFMLVWNDNIQRYAEDEGMIVPDVRRLYRLECGFEYFIKCVMYWCKHYLKQTLLRLKHYLGK